MPYISIFLPVLMRLWRRIESVTGRRFFFPLELTMPAPVLAKQIIQIQGKIQGRLFFFQVWMVRWQVGIDPFSLELRTDGFYGSVSAAPGTPRPEPHGYHDQNRHGNKHNDKKYSPEDFGRPLLVKEITGRQTSYYEKTYRYFFFLFHKPSQLTSDLRQPAISPLTSIHTISSIENCLALE